MPSLQQHITHSQEGFGFMRKVYLISLNNSPISYQKINIFYASARIVKKCALSYLVCCGFAYTLRTNTCFRTISCHNITLFKPNKLCFLLVLSFYHDSRCNVNCLHKKLDLDHLSVFEWYYCLF